VGNEVSGDRDVGAEYQGSQEAGGEVGAGGVAMSSNAERAFHEANEALHTVKREFTQASSLNAVTAYVANQACENAFRGIWMTATSTDFPYEAFRPHHRPDIWARESGLYPFYSRTIQVFLDKMEGWVLNDVRHVGSQPYICHTSPNAAQRGKEIINGVAGFIDETRNLATKPDALSILRNYKPMLP
jgi:hypothetical protein